MERKFIEAQYRGKFGARHYKLFVPIAESGASLPLLVMLHGCTQSPDEFAMGTRMNELASTYRCAVAYPAQSTSANRSRCWNWFMASDQLRGAGEPAILAGLTRQLVQAYGLDPNRVYVAGLSAGAAMAVILGRAYPDVYAAIGVHSGLPYAAAHDVPSAFDAMKGKAVGRDGGDSVRRRMPTIVLHGDCDETVHPSNAQRLFEQFMDGIDGEPVRIERQRIDEGGGSNPCTHTLLRDDTGKPIFESWLVHGGGHAWFGGNPLVKGADAKGPDASREMMRFFLMHRL